ncbi:MAG: single-stranded DNA-binding protein [Clostridia bacterium]|nr:single-stranded DNA-binding protein [Clostridia bacterium]
MSLNLNKVILGGRVASEPEQKQTPSGVSVVTYSMAVGRRFAPEGQERETDFFRVTAWQSTADFIARYFRKGDAICITGRIQNRSWTDRSGQKHYITEIIAEEANFVENKRDRPEGQAPASGTSAMPPPTVYTSPAAQGIRFEEIPTDDGCPF